MTVENWLRGHFQGVGQQIEHDVLAVAACSPVEANTDADNGRFRALELDEDYAACLSDEVSRVSLKYALSTLYYSMSSALTGGSKSEKRGNRSLTTGGYPLTTRDRDAFRKRANEIRKELGLEVADEESESGVMFDADSLRTKTGW